VAVNIFPQKKTNCSHSNIHHGDVETKFYKNFTSAIRIYVQIKG